MLFDFHIFMSFPNLFFCYWFLISFFLNKELHSIISIFWNFLRFVSWSNIKSILGNVPNIHSRRMYILLLNGVFCKCLLRLIGSTLISIVQVFFFYVDFCLVVFLYLFRRYHWLIITRQFYLYRSHNQYEN